MAELSDAYDRARARELALNQAQSVDGQKSTESAISREALIDPRVLAATAKELRGVVTEAIAQGTSPQEAALAFITQKPDVETDATIGLLMKFAGEYTNFARISGLKLESTLEQTKPLLNSFLRSAQAGYQQVRRAEEAVDLYRRQARSLKTVAEGLDGTVNLGSSMLRTAQSSVENIKKILEARAEAMALKKAA